MIAIEKQWGKSKIRWVSAEIQGVSKNIKIETKTGKFKDLINAVESGMLPLGLAVENSPVFIFGYLV